MFLKPVHAVRLGSGPPGPNYGPFKAKHNSYHMHVTMRMTLPTSICPTSLCATLSAHAEPAFLHSVQCDVAKSVHGRMSSVGTFHFEVDLKPRTRNKERKKCVQHLSSPATLVSTLTPLQPGQLTESFHA